MPQLPYPTRQEVIKEADLRSYSLLPFTLHPNDCRACPRAAASALNTHPIQNHENHAYLVRPLFPAVL